MPLRSVHYPSTVGSGVLQVTAFLGSICSSLLIAPHTHYTLSYHRSLPHTLQSLLDLATRTPHPPSQPQCSIACNIDANLELALLFQASVRYRLTRLPACGLEVDV